MLPWRNPTLCGKSVLCDQPQSQVRVPRSISNLQWSNMPHVHTQSTVGKFYRKSGGFPCTSDSWLCERATWAPALPSLMDWKFSYQQRLTKSKRVGLPPTMILENSQHYIITFDWSFILYPCFSLVNNWHCSWCCHFFTTIIANYRNGSMFWFTRCIRLSSFSANATDPMITDEMSPSPITPSLIKLLGQLRPLICKLRDLYSAPVATCGCQKMKDFANQKLLLFSWWKWQPATLKMSRKNIPKTAFR